MGASDLPSAKYVPRPQKKKTDPAMSGWPSGFGVKYNLLFRKATASESQATIFSGETVKPGSGIFDEPMMGHDGLVYD